MFMRQALKSGGGLFDLEKKGLSEQPQISTQNQNFDSVPTTQTQGELSQRSIRRQPPGADFQFNVQQIASSNSMAVAIVGCIVCCLTFTFFAAIFYFFVYDKVKGYVPFLNVVEPLDQSNILTELNAKQYFAKNPFIAGEFHYARIPVEYWDHRIQMVKSMGMNALSVYVFWNYHQIQKGKFDFENDNKNLSHFLDLAQKHNMTVLLRPGPYVCAEWDFGGLPARLLSIEGLKLRSSNNLFIQQTKIYFEELSKVIRPYIKQSKNPNGPILMIQVQNEPSWYTREKLYIEKLKQLWDEIKIGCPLYFDDIKKGFASEDSLYWQNAILAINLDLFESGAYDMFDGKKNFIFGGEVYSGWFSEWGLPKWQKQHQEKYRQNFVPQFSSLLAENRSFSMYLAHGGTNFGLTAGYNIITSYDYECPISEQGAAGDKYHIFRSILTNHTNQILPHIPNPIPTMEVTLGKTVPLSSMFDNLPQPIFFDDWSGKPAVFESIILQMYNQGMVMYEFTVKGPKSYAYEILFHDIAFVYVNDVYKTTLYRNKNEEPSKQIQNLNFNCEAAQCKVRILVQAMGHVNFGRDGKQMFFDKKGILKLSEKQIAQDKSKPQPSNSGQRMIYNYFKFDLQGEPAWANNQKCQRAPCLYYVEADLDETKDTYIDVSEFQKGYVWVNGHNLGRYWNIGPQQRLYCPGVWLNKGKNKILILDLFEHNKTVTIKAYHNLA